MGGYNVKEDTTSKKALRVFKSLHHKLTQIFPAHLIPGLYANECYHIFIFRGDSDICMGFPGGTSGKEPTCYCRRQKRRGFDLWVGKIPWRRAWQPNPVLPGEFLGQSSLAGYSP